MDRMQAAMPSATTPFGVCETPGVSAQNNLPPGGSASLKTLLPGSAAAAREKIVSGPKLACDQSMLGFEAAYRLTFYSSIGVLVLACFLPGRPGKWEGRGSTQTPMRGE